MWSLGYTQIKDQTEAKLIETLKENVHNSVTESTLATESQTESNGDTKAETFTEHNILDDLTTSTISECSDTSNLASLTQENVESKDKYKRASILNSSASDSETINLNVELESEKRNNQEEEPQKEQINGDVSENIYPETSTNIDELEDEFVLIDPNQFSMAGNSENESILKAGHKWQRELIFRSKLTMHTSFDRKDNSDPASVTAISISKDNRTIYVGDSKGRVYTWVCTENPGKTRADHWMRDEVVETCKNKKCNVKFSINVRKHHCRDCGGIFCNSCTRYETQILRLQILKPVRVCVECYNKIKAEEALFSSEANKNNN